MLIWKNIDRYLYLILKLQANAEDYSNVGVRLIKEVKQRHKEN
jgi:hypothetical protein